MNRRGSDAGDHDAPSSYPTYSVSGEGGAIGDIEMRILGGAPSNYHSVHAPLKDEVDYAVKGFHVGAAVGVDGSDQGGKNTGEWEFHLCDSWNGRPNVSQRERRALAALPAARRRSRRRGLPKRRKEAGGK